MTLFYKTFSYITGIITGVLIITVSTVFAQVQWERSEPATQPDLHLFHSPVGIDLPTATTLQKHDFEFEVSHRFVPTTGSGMRDFYGIDGPVNMRLALGYAPGDNTIITLGRSSYNDNVDLLLKHKLMEIRHDTFPTLIGVRVGTAWNSWPEYFEIRERDKLNIRNFQVLGQVIFNTLINDKFAIGLVPSYVYNPDIRWGPETDDSETKDILRAGITLQYYASDLVSFLWEWSPYVSGYKSLVGQEYNPMSFGFELETGGHFFKIFLTNNQYINATQYLAGADIPVKQNDWRIGFMITRLLKFTRN